MDVHVEWLVAAVRPRAKRHDPFEIQRHFDVTPSQAVELGARLHDIAGSGHRVTVVVVERAPDGRLKMPAFS